ncbi:PDZ domain-containing protein [Luteolibacter sp. SL250]|uniref:PDZ domain-containing protein n=1 Tax=Luteolibacter sp. SL250 TaxID=2995170 RepID=UPI00227189D5|nr:PDZ domain-containing protein [Luteolibacter sp. SL250]WAC21204.1 PDZ domain-containing protein [Luteolibacter sp. SL250]
MEGLSADKFVEREEAQKLLRQWAEKAPVKSTDVLLGRVRDEEDPEIRSRCLEALKAIVLEREYHADGFLGISMQEVEVKLPGNGGLVKAIRVTRVVEDSAAGQAGITEGTLIVGLGERMWKNGGMAMEFREQVKGTRPGTTITLQLLENGEVVRKALKVGERARHAGGFDEEDPVKANELAREEFFRRWLDKRLKQPR